MPMARATAKAPTATDVAATSCVPPIVQSVCVEASPRAYAAPGLHINRLAVYGVLTGDSVTGPAGTGTDDTSAGVTTADSSDGLAGVAITGPLAAGPVPGSLAVLGEGGPDGTVSGGALVVPIGAAPGPACRCARAC